MLQWACECRYLFETVISFPLDAYPEVERLVALFLIFWGTSVLFSMVPFYIPTNSTQGFPFLHILINIWCPFPSWRQPSKQAGGDISQWLVCISLVTGDVQHLFMHLLTMLVWSLKVILCLALLCRPPWHLLLLFQVGTRSWERIDFLEGLPRWCSGKESACKCRRHKRWKRHAFDPWVGKIPWRRKWQPTAVFLPGKSRGQRSLVGYSPWGLKEDWARTCELPGVKFYSHPQHVQHCRSLSIQSSVLHWLFFHLPLPCQLQTGMCLYLCKGSIMCCCSCWFLTPLKGVEGGG